MLLWIVMAVLTAAASLAVLAPLGRPSRHAAGADPSARSIYRDQLDELVRDRDLGLVAEADAEAARIEISRRLLKVDGTSSAAPDAAPRLRKAGVLVAVIAVPLVALGVYLTLGSPNLADQPLASRTIAGGGDEELLQLVAKVEEHLAASPEDGQGWEVLGPVYMRQGRFDDAARAFGNASRILGPTADREALLGEAITKAHAGVVTLDAKAAFDRALADDPSNVRAAFYQAVSLGQTGQKAEAVSAWSKLIAAAPADAAWLPSARAELARLYGTAAGAPGASAPVAAAPGPTAEDVQAAAGMSSGDRQQMIEGMVSGLAARLAASPDDVEGWARLFRAYTVMGRPQDATAALERARAALAGKPDLLAAIEKAAAESGIGKEEATP